MGPGAGRPEHLLYGVDAGGSGTAVRASDGTAWQMVSVNPASAGRSAAARSLRNVFARIRRHAATLDGCPAVWLASASLPASVPESDAADLAGLAWATGLRGDLLVSNDITPLAMAGPGPATAGHIVAVCGTGSGFVATAGNRLLRVGSCEYLGSDEGSAFDLAMNGLRAAVRGQDGRADPTALTGLFTSQTGMPVPDLARQLASAPFPKIAVAALAPVVLRGWRQGDQVAGRLVTAAIRELVLGVRAARDRAGLAPGWALSAAGGLFVGHADFFRKFVTAADGLAFGSARLIADPASAVLSALGALASAGAGEPGYPALGADVRCLTLTDAGVTLQAAGQLTSRLQAVTS